MEKKANAAGEQFYIPPPALGKWEGFKTFLWNSETSQFLGRTGSSWAKILFFYVVFYAALIGFFAAMLAVFYQTLDYKTPKWQLEKGLIGSNPGLGFRPMPPDENVESTLVWYKKTSEESVAPWVSELDKFLDETYAPAKVNQNNVQNCTSNQKPAAGKFCNVNLSNFGPCTHANKYNYPNGKPCIFLKLNKIFNWEPVLFTNESEIDKDKKMPSDLVDIIRGGKSTIDLIYVSCEGENPADNENIGAINYFPHRGFQSNYFPFVNIEGYLPPLVAVQFESPANGVLINIECKAWARNIKHDRADRRGSVHFELMID